MVGLRNTLKFQSNFKVLLNWRNKLSKSKDHINNKLKKINSNGKRNKELLCLNMMKIHTNLKKNSKESTQATHQFFNKAKNTNQK